MTSPLIDRLTDDLRWPQLDTFDDLDSYISEPGEHVLFVTGDPVKNLETNDAAVVLPEIRSAYQGRFDCAVVGNDIEDDVRSRFKTMPMPSFIFFRDGAFLGAIQRIRDWDDYMTRTQIILDGSPQAAE